MCGFVGWVNHDIKKPVDPSILKSMNKCLAHRGPDDEGYFIKDNVGIAHRRLSIIDTSSEGRQPIFNEDGTVLVATNGEIYNYLILRQELIGFGHIFSTRTDSEVIVHAYEEWGIDFLNRLDGMFSLVLFDIRNDTLILAKDPFGKKPLYYSHQNGQFLFSSELKAFSRNPYFRKSLDLGSLARYLAYEYVPTPHTILENCRKLRAASYILINTNELSVVPEPETYWKIKYAPKLKISESEAVDEFIRLLRQSVKKRLMSDVPLGLFLSGGIDSSSILALMSESVSSEKIKTFNIGFSEKSFDESSYSRSVSRHFGTDHYEEIIKPETMPDIFPTIIGKLDEPFADASIIPTYTLCKFAKKHVTVAIGGDGGDELLAGYDPFVALKFAFLIEYMPDVFIKCIRKVTEWFPLSDNNMGLHFRLKHFLKGFTQGNKNHLELRNNMWLGAFTPDAIRSLLISNYKFCPDNPFIYSETLFHKNKNRADRPIDRMIDNYIHLYLHDDILVKVDRASMLNSLEVRSPFLDKNLAEFVTCLPVEMKMKGLKRKFLLKEAIRDKLPNEILKRPKKGFGLPLTKWFKGPLKSLIFDTLRNRNGLFNHKFVEKLTNDHFNGRIDNRKEIWTLLVFELWRQANNL
jgi:asparagine synthase (glutamine-hydrolysing)